MMGGLALAALFFFVWVAAPFVGDVVQSAKEIMTREPTAEEKVDKLGTALGVRWQVIPERRRWVSHDAPDPEQEPEQPVVRNLSGTNTKEY